MLDHHLVLLQGLVCHSGVAGWGEVGKMDAFFVVLLGVLELLEALLEALLELRLL
jgi:hypothetical protein